MRLSLLESDLKSRMQDEIREMERRRAPDDRYFVPSDLLARREMHDEARRATLRELSAPAASEPSTTAESPVSGAPPVRAIAPTLIDPDESAPSTPVEHWDGARSTARWSSTPPRPWPTSPRSLRSSSLSSWPAAAVDAVAPSATVSIAHEAPAPRRSSAALVVALAAVGVATAALFGAAASRAELPRASAAEPLRAEGATVAACPSALEESPVEDFVAAPAPTLKPAPRTWWHARDDRRVAEARSDEDAGSPSPTPPAPLDQAARAAQMLREQLGSSVY